jgi:hypothetical protein
LRWAAGPSRAGRASASRASASGAARAGAFRARRTIPPIPLPIECPLWRPFKFFVAIDPRRFLGPGGEEMQFQIKFCFWRCAHSYFGWRDKPDSWRDKNFSVSVERCRADCKLRVASAYVPGKVTLLSLATLKITPRLPAPGRFCWRSPSSVAQNSRTENEPSTAGRVCLRTDAGRASGRQLFHQQHSPYSHGPRFSDVSP